MATLTGVELIKKIIREEDIPFFAQGEIEMYLDINKGDVNATIYQCLIVKSESSAISVSGMSTQDTSSYFKRLASKYRPNNSGILR